MKKTEGRGKKILVLFIGFIMVFSVFGVIFFGFSQAPGKIKYNGHVFEEKSNGWVTEIEGKGAFFPYLPQQVEHINISKDAIGLLKDKLEIDATYNVNDTFKEDIALAFYQMQLTLDQFTIYLRQGFTTNTSYRIPEIQCGNATAFVPVVYFRKSNETKVELENYCIIGHLERKDSALLIKDRLLYGIFGIIP